MRPKSRYISRKGIRNSVADSDRLLTADGQLYYPTSGVPESPWVSEVYGDVILMNGRITPYLDVEPRPYRFAL